jgi:23S rRNA (adenine2503-C2)-methyltransferase
LFDISDTGVILFHNRPIKKPSLSPVTLGPRVKASHPNLKEQPSVSMQDFFDLSPSQLQTQLLRWGESAYRTRQVIAAAWETGAANFQKASALPITLRRNLDQTYLLPPVWQLASEIEAQDSTLKAVFHLADGAAIESVAIPKDDRLTFCLSTQAGCAMGCRFCASALGGLKRSLTAGEIIGQIRALTHRLGRRPTNLVLMGMGEPLQNLEAVRSALEQLTHPQAWNWSPNKTVVSTSGWLPGLEELLRAPLPAKLAFSLNAPTELLRSQLMPVNRRYPLEHVLNALRRYTQTTGDAVCIEYVLLGGVNDRPQDARLLGRLLKNLPCKINLIPYNPVPGRDYRAPAPAAITAFVRELRQHHLLCTLRTSRGCGIAAACGQLAGQANRSQSSATSARPRPSGATLVTEPAPRGGDHAGHPGPLSKWSGGRA